MDATSPDLDWLVSVDDHVIEPPNVWLDRLPAKYHDVGAADARRRPTGCTRTRRCPTSGLSVTIGKRKEEFTPARRAVLRDGARRAYDPKARIEDMNRAGILGSLCFPSFPRFCGQIFWEAKDKELAHPLRAGLQRLDDRRVVRLRARVASSR